MEEYLSSVESLAGSDLDSVNPYALSSRRKTGPTARNNRRFPRFFNDFSDCDTETQHFLDSCYLCKKPLSGNRDIFMYRGDMPFCSEECRMTKIEEDEAREKNNSVSLKASSRKELRREEREISPKSQKARTGSILAG